jgi:hypothetical protein
MATVYAVAPRPTARRPLLSCISCSRVTTHRLVPLICNRRCSRKNRLPRPPPSASALIPLRALLLDHLPHNQPASPGTVQRKRRPTAPAIIVRKHTLLATTVSSPYPLCLFLSTKRLHKHGLVSVASKGDLRTTALKATARRPNIFSMRKS